MVARTIPSNDEAERTGGECEACGGELLLSVDFNGELIEHPRRPGFFRIRCVNCGIGGTDNSEALRVLKLDRRPRLVMAPEHMAAAAARAVKA